MSKTPEELAAEYADSQWPRKKGFTYGGLNRWLNEAFLAGHQAAAPQWISVKDRLPEEDQEVLIYDWPSRSTCIFWKSRKLAHQWELSNGRNCNPTHWMPLPKPPEDK